VCSRGFFRVAVSEFSAFANREAGLVGPVRENVARHDAYLFHRRLSFPNMRPTASAAPICKAVFREYTDDTFRTLKPRPPELAHMGLLGPVIRAEVGDTIKVVFRNNATFPFSLHPHGVAYT
jgi:hypothetical protein